MVSLVVSTVLTAFGNYLDSILPFGQIILTVLNVIVSLVLISFLFAAIYKVLPDRNLEWGDVVVGAIVTGVLFTIGKSLISWYVGSSAVASSFGAAGALIVLLLWVYYSAQIFLLGAEFTKVYANRRGSKQDHPVAESGAALGEARADWGPKRGRGGGPSVPRRVRPLAAADKPRRRNLQAISRWNGPRPRRKAGEL